MEHDARNLLLVRQYIYNLLHIIFGQAPSKSLLDAFLCEESLKTLEAYDEECLSPFRQALKEAEDAGKHYLNSEDDVQALKLLGQEYTRLFVGPDAPPAPPWEMIYRTVSALEHFANVANLDEFT